ncbi:MAG: PD-(D/E)XK nuclease family protein [Campylobacterota bacterium]|nr:PD-(D/E)XK nuclease family protein [Campylobacterota bacterium]
MEIKKLEKKLKDFKAEQQQQKLRGLNNYNIMGVLRKLHAEVGMHSNFIYSLLDINGDHFQGDLFAKLFVVHVLNIDNFGEILDVQMEKSTFNNRRIDFTIKSDKYFIGIEMKIYASDEKNQISDYYIDLDKEVKDKRNPNKNAKVKIYYLTLDGKKASHNSYQDKPYTSISFNKEILNWLQKCQKQVSNITNLNNAIGYYTDVVDMLVGKYTSPIKEYKDFFLDKDMYECYKENEKHFNDDSIKNGFKEAQQILYNAFYKRLISPIIKQNDNIIFDHYDIKNKKIVLNIYSYYEIWIILSSNAFKSIGIRPAYNIQWQGNNGLTLALDNANKFLSSNESLKDYIIGKKKGVDLNENIIIPHDKVSNLFLSLKNEVEKLDNNIIVETQNHITIIKQALEEK